MKLRVSSTSPYARKVCIFAIEAGVDKRIDLVPTMAWSPDTDLPKDNPLGKVPTLVLNNGHTLFDSHVICEYLDTLHTGPKLIPTGENRIPQLRLHALADGILDASVSARIEGSIRPEPYRWQGWIDRQVAAVNRSLDELEKECSGWGEIFQLGQIAVITALGYVDFRMNMDWRKGRPNLTAWEAVASKRPSVVATVPKE